tara:strand:+ start:226 stop:1152 length:927 start_codon:yes stop_codon:yes gene_type:complete
MESWRKFLKEEESDNRFPEEPHDPMSGEKMLFDPELAKKNKEMLASLNKGDETYPIVDGKNFLIPIPGIPGRTGGATFNQPRGPLKHKGGRHAAWDQWVPVGTPVQAPADGVVTRTILAGRGMDYAAIAMVKKLHLLEKEGVDLGLSILPPRSINSWNKLRAWNKKFAPPNALSSLIRRRKDLSIPPNGKGLILITDPDQNGTRFKFIFSHMDEVTASTGPIKAGQPLGATGTTGVFDDPAHLHFEILVSESNPMKGPLAGSLSKNPGSHKVGQIDPIRVIPGLEGAKASSGTYADVEPTSFSPYQNN